MWRASWFMGVVYQGSALSFREHKQNGALLIKTLLLSAISGQKLHRVTLNHIYRSCGETITPLCDCKYTFLVILLILDLL